MSHPTWFVPRRTLMPALLFVALLLPCRAAEPEPGAAPASAGETVGAAPAAATPENLTAEKSARELPRPPSWAQPVEAKGIDNFFKVSDDLYRGAEPLGSGYAELKKMGVRTVINLRAFHSDVALCEAATLVGAQIRMRQLTPAPEDVEEFLRIVTNPEYAPVFVHCDKGAERTGVMCAVYRMALCDWSKQDAIKEMTDGGFGRNIAWLGLVNYIKGLNLETLRKQAAAARAEHTGEKPPAEPAKDPTPQPAAPAPAPAPAP